MDIKSIQLGSITVSKNPKYVSKVYEDKDLTVSGKIALTLFDIEKNIRANVNLSLEIRSKLEDNSIAKYFCTVVVDLNLNKKEIEDGEEIRRKINYFLITQVWSTYEAKIKLLNDIKVYLETLPMPSKEKVYQMTLVKEKDVQDPNKRK